MTTPEQKPMWWNRSPQAHYRRQPMRPNHVQRIRSRSDRAWAPSLSTPIIGPLGAGHTMKAIFGISFIAIIAIRLALAADSTSPDLREYVCTNRFFAVPESFQTTNVEECRRLVKANPNRFEPHLVLATALTQIGPEEAVEEFRIADELSSKVKDREVLASLPYEDIYAFALCAAADKRLKQNTNDLSALRMLQQAIGMDLSELRKNKRLAQCYMMMGVLYLQR